MCGGYLGRESVNGRNNPKKIEENRFYTNGNFDSFPISRNYVSANGVAEEKRRCACIILHMLWLFFVHNYIHFL